MRTTGLAGAEVFLRILFEMQVERIFASPGSEWAPVWEFLANLDLSTKPQYLSSRHEEIAVAMASGYAKASGRLPAVMLHTTVGALHASMALRGALHENIPMVVFAGESIAFGEGAGPDPGGHWLWQLADIGGPARLVERCVKWSFAINTPAILSATLIRACQLAMTAPKGPVFVSLPLEFLAAAVPTEAAARFAYPGPPTIDGGGLDKLMSMLLNARHPVIVTQECGRNPTAVQPLVELAELLCIPVVEPRAAGYMNFPRHHMLHAGFDAAPVLADADFVLVLEAKAPWHPPSANPNPGARVVILSENPLRAELPYWGYQPDLWLTGAVADALTRILEKAREQVQSADPIRATRLQHWDARHREQQALVREEALACKNQKPLNQNWLLYALNEILPSDAIVIEETITHRSALDRYLNRLKPGHFFSGAIGGLGTGLGTALGVKCAVAQKPVILLIGDGSFNYNPVLAGLGFCQEFEMPIMVIILNNHGYLSQKLAIPMYYPEGWSAKTNTFVGTSITPSPDYAALAQSFGAHGEKVEEPSDIRFALERGLKALMARKAAIIDMRLVPVN